MALPQFWASPDGHVYVQLSESELAPSCFATNLLARSEEIGDSRDLIWVATPPDGGRHQVHACRVPMELIESPPGTVRLDFERLKRLSDLEIEEMNSSVTAFVDGWPTAFEGRRERGRRLATLIAGLLGLRFTSHVITEHTSSHDIMGNPRNPRTIVDLDFLEALGHGGVYFVDVPVLDRATAKVLTIFSPYLQPTEPGQTYTVHFMNGFTRHADLYLIFNLPASITPLPPEFATNIHFVNLEGTEERASVSGTQFEVGDDLGPSSVLVLMKFGVPSYERWYHDVVRPVVEARDSRRCVRIAGNVSEWHAQLRRALPRVDAVLVDLSHDLTRDLSPNVIWELTEVYWAATRQTQASQRLKRDKVLCYGRCLESVRSRDGYPDDVFTADINSSWVPTIQRSLNIEEVLGLRVRRYNPDSEAGVARFREWLSSSLAPWVQGVPPPLSCAEVRHLAAGFGATIGPIWRQVSALDQGVTSMAAQRGFMDAPEKSLAIWALAVERLDIGGCWKLFETTGEVPDEIADLCGAMLCTVSAVDAAAHHGYWTMARHVAGRSPILQNHLAAVLSTEHIHTPHHLTSHFRDQESYAKLTLKK